MGKFDQIFNTNDSIDDISFSSSELILHGLQSIAYVHQGYSKKEIKSAIEKELNRQEMKSQNFLGSTSYSYDLSRLPDFGITFEVPQHIPNLTGKEIFEQLSRSMICFSGTVVEVGKMRFRLMKDEFECRVCGHKMDISFLSESVYLETPKVCDMHLGGCGRNTSQTDFDSTGKKEYEEFFVCKIKPDKSRRHLTIDVSDIECKEIYSLSNHLKITAILVNGTKPITHHIFADVIS